MSDISKIKVSGVEYDIKDIQARKDLGNLSDLNTEAKNNLVAAINEAAQSGGGGGSTVELDTTLSETGKAADAKAVGDALAGKVDKATGKGLSSNDYTDTDKAKVDALAPVATSGSYNDLTDKPTIPTVLPNPHKLTINGTEYDGSTDVQMTIEGGGSSVPKPLTYDYMPEGYPSKSVQTTTLMEEQEIAFASEDVGIYGALLTNALEIVEGQTYTVKWDGTEYECIGATVGENTYALGNLSIAGAGADTGEPFIYANNPNMGSGFNTLDTSASHTISVKRIVETVTPMAEEYLPENIATKPDVEVAQTAANAAQTAANAAQTAAKDAQFAAKAALNTAKNALPLSGGEIRISGGNQVATLTLNEFTGSTGVQKRGICIGGSGAYGHPILEVEHDDITIYDKLLQRRTGGLNSRELFLSSKNSDKTFKITVDDSGTLSATEVI